MTRLFLMRHARSRMNAERRVQGWLDSPLDGVGREQAHALGRRLRREELDALYSSPLKRALETAQIVAEMLDLPLIEDERLKERGVGAIAGLNSQEIEERFPEWVESWRERPGAVPPPGGECHEALWGRVEEAFTDILARHPDGAVGVVTHGGVLNVYLTHLVGVKRGYPSHFSFANGSISIVDLSDRDLRIRLVNDQCHLENGGDI